MKKRVVSILLAVILVLSSVSIAFADSSYTVKPGDVLWKIAEKYNTTWQELAESNNLKNPHLIFPGQVINLEGTSTSAKFKAGTYAGEGKGIHGTLGLTVKVDESRILEINFTKMEETPGLGDIAAKKVADNIIKYQSLGIDTVSGATYSSNGVIEAATKALTLAGANISALNKKVVQTETADTVSAATVDTDVVVIGAGGAGMAAAISAKANGANVIVVEKMSMVGGNTLRASGGINAAGTPQQKAAGIVDSPELFYQDTMKGGYNKNNPDLVKVLTEKSAEAVKWLESLGAEFTGGVGASGGASVNRMHKAKDGVAVGSYLVPIMKKAADSKNIEFRMETKVTEILTEKDGNVSGVKVVNKDGKEYSIYAKSVILASGGFGANLDMVTKYNPDLKDFQTTNHPGATGDGIVMAEKLGAQLVDMKEIQIHPTTIPGNGYLISETVRGDGAILVNHEGKRFINELLTRDVVSKGVLSLPEKTAFILFDQKVPNKVKMVAGYIKSGYAVEGNTIEELAAKMKVNPENLKATIEKYNNAVEAKKDEEFGRTNLALTIDTPKYYAIEITPGIHHTMGGVKINTNAEVIGAGDKAIKNFYAAGEVTGGVHGGNRLGGNAVLDITVYGKIAGENAAKNALGK